MKPVLKHVAAPALLLLFFGCSGIQDAPDPTVPPRPSRQEVIFPAGGEEVPSDDSSEQASQPVEDSEGSSARAAKDSPSGGDEIDAIIESLDHTGDVGGPSREGPAPGGKSPPPVEAADTKPSPDQPAEEQQDNGPDSRVLSERTITYTQGDATEYMTDTDTVTEDTAEEEPPGELPDRFAELLRKQKDDVDLDLDGDGRPEISMQRLADGGARITLCFPADGGFGTRRYRVDEDGRILRFVRDDDGDGRAEEILLAALKGSWFRAAEGEDAYYIIQGSEESGKAQAWKEAGLLPSPLVLLKYMNSEDTDLQRLLANPDVESHWMGGERSFFHDRERRLLGAAFREGMLSAGSRLLPHSRPALPSDLPAKPALSSGPSREKIPANSLLSVKVFSSPADYRDIPNRFILVGETERKLLEPKPFRHLVRGMPEELLAPPKGRVLCRSAPGTYRDMNRPVMYVDSEGGWKGWFDRDGDGMREASILRWGTETVLEYPEDGQIVSELLYRGRLTEKRFRPPDEQQPRVVEYHGESGLVRREMDTNRDGRFDRFEFPDDGGFRVYVDSDGDGLPDKWLKKGSGNGSKGNIKTQGDAAGKPEDPH